MIAHGRTEKRVKEVERVADSDRRKLKSQVTELTKQLEDERITRKTLDKNLHDFKGSSQSNELEKDKLINELTLRLDKVVT